MSVLLHQVLTPVYLSIRFCPQAKTKYLENIIKNHERTISDFEEENVRLSKEHEERQLLWEQREVELERMIDSMERQQEEMARAAAKFEEATGSIPDPNLPVANQLELAITNIKQHIRVIVATREENKQLRKVCRAANQGARFLKARLG